MCEIKTQPHLLDAFSFVPRFEADCVLPFVACETAC